MAARLLAYAVLSLWSWLPSDPDAVVLSRDLPRFPGREECLARQQAAGDYREALHQFYGTGSAVTAWTWALPPEEQGRLAGLDAALVERWLIYCNLAQAGNEKVPAPRRRARLTEARRLMGERAFWSGELPPPVPVELLREAP